MNTLKKTRGKYLLVLLAMCGLVSASLGVMTNAGGIFFSPMAAELGQPTAAVNLTLTISNLAFAAAGLFSARWVKPKNFRPTVAAFGLLFAGSTALLSLCRGMTSLYLVSAVRGFSSGLIGNVLVTSVLGRWFLSDTGFITSLALGSSGLVGALCNPLLEAVIRSAGWRTAYLISAGLILLLTLPAMAFPISFLPEDSGMRPIGNPEALETRSGNQAPRGGAAPGPGILAAAILAFSLISLVTSVPQLFKPIAETYGLGETGILMMSVVLVANTAGKFLLGLMTDRIGVRRSFLIYCLVIAAGIALLLLTRVSGLLLASAAMIGLCYALPTVAAVMICRELFSPDRYSVIFPKINLGVSIANALGYPLLGLFFDRTGKYDGALVMILIVVLLSAACVLTVYRLASRGKAARE